MKRSEMVSAIESYLIKNDIPGAKLNGDIWANEILEVIEKEGMLPPNINSLITDPQETFKLLLSWEPEETKSRSGAI